jgi:lipopolysaccharide export system protein LptA
MRKFVVGLISVAAVLAIYLLYSRMSKAPVIDIGTRAEFVETIADSNVGESGGEIGKIGGIGVESLKRTVYRHRNENGQVDREFGFDELLYEVKDIWEVEKPWMNAYQRSFKCYITADKGTARLETAVGRPTPKDATFTGNVVIHILPENSSKIKESRIYLDDLVFLSERSQFSTGGQVEFVSEDARMLGTGLELVYDDQMERLEFLKIIDLESLRLKSSRTAFLPGATKQADREADTDGQAKTQQPDEPTMAGDRQKAQALPITSRRAIGQTAGQYYKCVFSKNVVIDTPEQLVFADERVCINDIFWSEASSEKSEEANIDGIDDTKTIAGTAEQGRQSKAGSVGADSTQINTTTVSEQSEPNGLPEESFDMVITCDGGVVVTPMDSRQAADNFAEAGIGATGSESQRLKKFDDTTGRTTFIARRIDHSAVTGDTVASGPSEFIFYSDAASQKNRKTLTGASDVTGAETKETNVAIKISAQKETKFIADSNQVIFEGDCLCTMPQAGLSKQENATLSSPKLTVNLPKEESKQSSTLPDVFAAGPAELTFYMDDFSGARTQKTPLPAKVTAQKQARFLAASNQVIFEGDCRCTMLREAPNVLTEYILSSQQLFVDLPRDTNDQSSTSTAGVEHLTATGGVVRLATVKTAQEKLLGGIELKCRRFDYDAGQELFVATGPGSITLDNSTVAEPNVQKSGFSLEGPCWAIVENFDTLKYFLASNRIVAEAESAQGLVINYFPIREGKFAEHIIVNTGHVEADLVQTADGQTELSTLTASGRVTYEDQENEFAGSKLFYDHKTSVMKVEGDESAPCYFNGALVEGIELNSKTRRVEAKVVAPGALQLNR